MIEVAYINLRKAKNIWRTELDDGFLPNRWWKAVERWEICNKSIKKQIKWFVWEDPFTSTRRNAFKEFHLENENWKRESLHESKWAEPRIQCYAFESIKRPKARNPIVEASS